MSRSFLRGILSALSPRSLYYYPHLHLRGRAAHSIPGTSLDLSRLSSQGGVYAEWKDGALCLALIRRGVSGARAVLPGDCRVPEGAAETQGLGRTAVCRGQSVAWRTPFPFASVVARQHGGSHDSHWPESHAVTRAKRMGTPTATKWSGARHGASGRSHSSFGHICICLSTPRERDDPRQDNLGRQPYRPSGASIRLFQQARYRCVTPPQA